MQVIFFNSMQKAQFNSKNFHSSGIATNWIFPKGCCSTSEKEETPKQKGMKKSEMAQETNKWHSDLISFTFHCGHNGIMETQSAPPNTKQIQKLDKVWKLLFSDVGQNRQHKTMVSKKWGTNSEPMTVPAFFRGKEEETRDATGIKGETDTVHQQPDTKTENWDGKTGKNNERSISLTNKDVKILKILLNQFQHHVKSIIHHN